MDGERIELFGRLAQESIRDVAERKYAMSDKKDHDKSALERAEKRSKCADEWARRLRLGCLSFCQPRVIRVCGQYGEGCLIPHGGLYVVVDVNFVFPHPKSKTGNTMKKVRVFSLHDLDSTDLAAVPKLGTGFGLNTDEMTREMKEILDSEIRPHLSYLRTQVLQASVLAERAAPSLVTEVRRSRSEEDGEKLLESISEILKGSPLRSMDPASLVMILNHPKDVQKLVDYAKGSRAVATGATVEICERAARLALTAEVMET